LSRLLERRVGCGGLLALALALAVTVKLIDRAGSSPDQKHESRRPAVRRRHNDHRSIALTVRHLQLRGHSSTSLGRRLIKRLSLH
jgi:hypothetical protein